MWEKVFCIKKLTSNEGSYSNDGLHFGFFFVMIRLVVR